MPKTDTPGRPDRPPRRTTLLEVLVVCAILAILAVVAYWIARLVRDGGALGPRELATGVVIGAGLLWLRSRWDRS